MPAIRENDRVLIIDRRIFRDDNTRLFVGIVEEYDDGIMRVRGSAFHLSPYEVAGTERRGDERLRAISLSAGDMIYLLPREVEVTKLQLKRSPKALLLTDNQQFTMDLSDWLLRA
jgi:hypothetical protein